MLTGVVGLAPGTFHTILVKQDGSVWSTGVNLDDPSESFVQVMSSGAMAAAAGNDFSVVLKRDGTVYTTRQNSRAEHSIFDGSANDKGTFSVVANIPGAKAIAAGGYHSMVLTQEGRVWVTGWNNYGQLGDQSTKDNKRFFRVISDGVVAMAAGDIHSVVLKHDGSVWATGRNFYGQLGDCSRVDRNSFVKVIPRSVADVAAGGYHSMVLKQDGSVWATGWNNYGQLGDGDLQQHISARASDRPADATTTDRIKYAQVIVNGARVVAAGSLHSVMLKQDGSVWATGYNLYGQLGDGSTTDSNVFKQVISHGAISIAAGAFHSMVLRDDGNIWVTGANQHGQFGDGSTTSSDTFVRIEPFGNDTFGIGTRIPH